MSLPPRAALSAMIAVLALVLIPAAAHAASDMRIGIADDGALLQEPDPARAAATVRAWADLGIDDVRIFAAWNTISPRRDQTTPPAGFDPANPDATGYDWTALDRAIALVRAADMTVTLVVSGPGPLWGTSVPGRHQVRYKPRPDLFGRFAAAVAKRYAAAVDRYVIWNEPNIPLWLQPQFSCVGRRCSPYAPHLYRRLVRAAYPAIKAADPQSTVLFGALAPRGGRPLKRNSIMKPLTFLRALGCVNPRLKRDRRGACAGFLPLTADGFAYHPHSVKRAPDQANPDREEASMGDLRRLERTLDGAQGAGGFRKPGGGRYNLYFTEYAYQTNPPDRFEGVSLAKQSRWLQQGAYLAYRDPRVKLLTQYEWRDERLGRGGLLATTSSGWQSGLRFANDLPKPILAAFPNIFHVQRLTRTQVRLWGQVRPGEDHVVTVQRKAATSTRWASIRTLATNGDGYWTFTQSSAGSVDYRYSWQPRDSYGAPSGPPRYSDVVRVKRPAPRRR